MKYPYYDYELKRYIYNPPPVEIPGRVWDGFPDTRHHYLTVGSRVVYENYGADFIGTVTSPPVQARGYDGAWSVMVQWDANIGEYGPVNEPCEDLAIIEGGAK